MTANKQRASRFEAAVNTYSGEAQDTNLVDFLADAMHWCDTAGEDFHWLLTQACRHYVHELNDEQQDERRLIP